MSTEWVITNASERITLDEQRQGETTFTVSNPGMNADRAVFEIVPGEGADPSWFVVGERQRQVPGAGSVPFQVKVAVPADAEPGSYVVQARVYSADLAPEESSVLSGRVAFDVAGAGVPVPSKPKPWWLIAVAALVVLVVGVVTWVVLASGDDDKVPASQPGPLPTSASPSPSASPSASATPGPAKVPNLVTLTLDQATKELQAVGLSVGTLKRRHVPASAGTVLSQGTAATTAVPPGSKVDLVVAVNLAGPQIASPGDGASYGRDTSVSVRWSQTETWVAKWRVQTYKQTCYYYVGHNYRDCRWDGQATADATVASYTARFDMGYQPLLNLGWYQTGPVQARISAIDDFGTAGPETTVNFRIG